LLSTLSQKRYERLLKTFGLTPGGVAKANTAKEKSSAASVQSPVATPTKTAAKTNKRTKLPDSPVKSRKRSVSQAVVSDDSHASGDDEATPKKKRAARKAPRGRIVPVPSKSDISDGASNDAEVEVEVEVEAEKEAEYPESSSEA
jgi:hypothetical protein